MAATSSSAVCICLAALVTLLQSASAYNAVIRVRNSNITINSGQAAAAPQVNTVQIQNGVNPLKDFSYVGVNNTYITINGTVPAYNGVMLDLQQGNTLAVNNTRLFLNISTVVLTRQNNLYVKNGSLELKTTPLNVSDLYAFNLDNSSFSTQNSVVGLKNVRTTWHNAKLNIQDSSVNVTQAPPYQLASNGSSSDPTLYVDGSNIYMARADWTIRNMPYAEIRGSHIGLRNTSINIINSTVAWYGDVMSVNTSMVYIQDSNVSFFQGFTTIEAVTAVKNPGDGTPVPGFPQSLVGQPLGQVNGQLTKSTLDIQFT